MSRARSSVENMPCVAGTLRRASRSLARLYDLHLGRAGLTTTQFSILRTVQGRGGRAPLAVLVEDLVMERTSLFRALAPLQRARLIAVRAGADRRSKELCLTARAATRIAAAMPHWIEAQRIVLRELGQDDWHDLARRLKPLTDGARAAHAR
jgi:DNA-binding MarR family transcriptional regulator